MKKKREERGKRKRKKQYHPIRLHSRQFQQRVPSLTFKRGRGRPNGGMVLSRGLSVLDGGGRDDAAGTIICGPSLCDTVPCYSVLCCEMLCCAVCSSTLFRGAQREHFQGLYIWIYEPLNPTRTGFEDSQSTHAIQCNPMHIACAWWAYIYPPT